MYKIMYRNQYGEEEIDTADTLKEAKELVQEYRVAYHNEGTIRYTK